MKRYRKYRPYVRRINGRERAHSLRDALRLALFTELGGYVMVQRGFPNDVMAVAGNKRDLVRSILSVACGKSFGDWATELQKKAASA